MGRLICSLRRHEEDGASIAAARGEDARYAGLVPCEPLKELCFAPVGAKLLAPEYFAEVNDVHCLVVYLCTAEALRLDLQN